MGRMLTEPATLALWTKSVARRLLVQAFIGDAFVALDDEDARERLMRVALDKLDRHL